MFTCISEFIFTGVAITIYTKSLQELRAGMSFDAYQPGTRGGDVENYTKGWKITEILAGVDQTKDNPKKKDKPDGWENPIRTNQFWVVDRRHSIMLSDDVEKRQSRVDAFWYVFRHFC